MTDETLTYDDIKEYEHLFTMAPPFVLELMIKRNVNLVDKFRPTIVKYMEELTPQQKQKLTHILSADTERLQKLMFLAYKKTGKKQYYTLANPANRDFVEMNINGIRQLADF